MGQEARKKVCSPMGVIDYMMVSKDRAAVTKDYRLGGLKNRN